jgi:zinc protease
LALPGSFETDQQLSTGYGTILEYGLPEDYYNTFTEKALAVTPESANQIARKYVLPDHLIWVVVGDMSKVEAGIRELNVGEVHKIDADGKPVQ